MCGRYSIYEFMDHYLKELAPKQLMINGYDLWPIDRYNVAPTTSVEIIRPHESGLSIDNAVETQQTTTVRDNHPPEGKTTGRLIAR